jgi:hypothetical protein
MALPARRAYAGAAPACTLSSDISNSATSFSITGTTTNWPTTATGPFYMVIDPGLSTEEKVLVGARTTGSLSSVTRAVDGTTASAHVAGATCYPVFTAVDANEANLLASTMTTKGDLLSTDGSDPKRVAVGSNNTRLVADSAQTAGIKWVADTQNTVVDAKGDLLVGTAADTVARLAVGADGKVLEAASGETTGLKWGGIVGLELVKTQTIGTGVTSVTVTSAFSSSFDVYKITVSGGAGSGTEVLRLQLGGSTTGYYQGLNYVVTNATTTPAASGTDNTTAYFDSCGIASANGLSANIELLNPGLAKYTVIHNPYAFISGGDAYVGTNVGIHGVATAYTDFTLSCAGGTMTGGTIRVYGYRNS